MPSFSSLHTVRTGLFAQRRALELVGQNISNASTVGYSRQEASFLAAEPKNVIQSSGRGISEIEVLRFRDQFSDRQYRGRNGALGYHSARSSMLSQLEKVLGDLSDTGLRASLDQFFNSWQNLSLHPSDPAARYLVTLAAKEFVGSAKTTFQDTVQQRVDIDETIQVKVQELNSAARQVADINKALVIGVENEEAANLMRDRRDLLLDSMSKIAGATVNHHNDGTVTVYLGSLELVDREFSFPVDATDQLEPDRGTPPVSSLQQFVTTLTWNGTAVPAKFASGELGGLLEMRDQVLPTFMEYLDTFMRAVAVEVNTRHNAGVPPGTEIEIFTVGSTWMDIDLNAAVAADSSLILAAGTLPAKTGDGERARAIAGIRDALILMTPPAGTKSATPVEYLRTVGTLVGMMVQEADSRAETSALQLKQADNLRQSQSGVSLDDEMTKMIQFQQAYNAAARTMTTIDEMLDVVINRMGLAGR